MIPNEVEKPKKTRRKRKTNRFSKPIFEPTELGKNNFINKSFQVPFVKMKTDAVVITNLEDGSRNYKKYNPEVEYLNFTKVFLLDSLQQDVVKLSLRAKELLLYIIYNVSQGKDYIAIERGAYMQLHSIKTEPTYLGAVKELCKENFIAETGQVKDVYWINPYYFFYGSRLKTFPDNKILLKEFLDKQDAEDLEKETI